MRKSIEKIRHSFFMIAFVFLGAATASGSGEADPKEDVFVPVEANQFGGIKDILNSEELKPLEGADSLKPISVDDPLTQPLADPLKDPVSDPIPTTTLPEKPSSTSMDANNADDDVLSSALKKAGRVGLLRVLENDPKLRSTIGHDVYDKLKRETSSSNSASDRFSRGRVDLVEAVRDADVLKDAILRKVEEFVNIKCESGSCQLARTQQKVTGCTKTFTSNASISRGDGSGTDGNIVVIDDGGTTVGGNNAGGNGANAGVSFEYKCRDVKCENTIWVDESMYRLISLKVLQMAYSDAPAFDRAQEITLRFAVTALSRLNGCQVNVN